MLYLIRLNSFVSANVDSSSGHILESHTIDHSESSIDVVMMPPRYRSSYNLSTIVEESHPAIAKRALNPMRIQGLIS